ncbi:probable RNA-directed DNA polymerase from transposon X-element [Trichonephila clavipes]|nr:probable RNA-directed DNA polymerase from transposon X-element [Trichonephila clavipes]
MKAQKVCDVRRITIRRDGQVLNTKHLILTFSTPDLPQTVKMAYIRCPVRPYIPNLLRCFQCQRFGHSKTFCRGQPTCSRCAEARRVVSSRTPVSGKSYASATSKSFVSTAIQVDASTAPTSVIAATVTPKNVAVDTLKSVSPPRDTKKNRKTRIKDSGRRESDGRSVAQTFVFWLLARSKCEDFVTSFISWNCRGLRTRLADLKSIISTYQPACVALQETFLKSTMTMQVRGYNCVRRDVDGDTSPTGGVCLFTSNLFPSNVVTLHTSLQAVAVRIHIHSLVTVCCVYLPPNDVVPQVDLNRLVSQLPAPFLLLGDFNGHSPLWGHDDTNSRGRHHLLAHSATDVEFRGCRRSAQQRSFPCPRMPMQRTDFKLTRLRIGHTRYTHRHLLFGETAPECPSCKVFYTVQHRAVVEAVFSVTEAIRNAADAAIPKTFNSPRKLCKPWWNASCQQAKKEQRRAWGIFRRYPTTDNLIAFKRAKALARRIRRQCQRESWIKYVSSITSSTTSQQLWRKVKAANGLYREFNIPILETSTALFSSPLDVASLIGKTFASVSSSDSYSPAFQATKNRLERTPINFRCRQPLPYNCDFDMFELKRALSSAHNTSPGPDGISYVLLRHLNEDSLVSLLYLFNRIWREQVYPTQWQEAIVIPILKPGKDPKNPLSYRPIALTSCLCKTLERMVNARLVYQLEKNKCIPLFQSGFRKGRSTLDNIITLENKIRNAFVRRNHLVSIFFDIEKAYDRTWRYGILRTLFDFGFRGNLPTFIQHF